VRQTNPTAKSSGTAPRLFVPDDLRPGVEFALSGDQTHYLLAVLRRNPGDPVVLFNGRDGEWSGHIAKTGRRDCTVAVTRERRMQSSPPDIDYLFAPLKKARLDYIVQKATELGVRRICPVFTQHTVPGRVNVERLAANAMEAAEQCGALHVPVVEEPRRLDAVLDTIEADRPIIFCDEAAAIADPLAALSRLPRGKAAVLVGPEGGFSRAERDGLLARENVTAVSLGPRILRADTAGTAALTLVQAILGDWRA